MMALPAKTPTAVSSPPENVPCVECVRRCAEVAAEITKGDLSFRINCDQDACNKSDLVTSMNAMAAKLYIFTDEVIQSVKQGSEGKLGVQAKLDDEHGIWKEFVSHLNTMTMEHSEQVRDIASVCSAVTHGDLRQKMTVAVKGETLVLKNTVNTMVDQLSNFSNEVTRVAYQVGTSGRLGGAGAQVDVDADGDWKELADKVNTMATNAIALARDIALVSKAVALGDLSKRITVQVQGEMLDLKNTINTMVDYLQEFATEISRVTLEVGTEGKLGGQAVVVDVSGTWKELTDNINTMTSNFTTCVRSITEVTTAVTRGDLVKVIDVQAHGEIAELKEAINYMVEYLRIFAHEVTRFTCEVGTEGKLGGQARVYGVDGMWKELMDNVNTMASNLTIQVRDIYEVCLAVAKGDLSKRSTVQCKGEMLDLKNLINIMIEHFQEFATEIMRLCSEVGTEGKLGDQASMDAMGTWKELIDVINTMIANYTIQVRDIVDVSKAVTKGDLSKRITIEGKGEILEVKHIINIMLDQMQEFTTEMTRLAEILTG